MAATSSFTRCWIDSSEFSHGQLPSSPAGLAGPAALAGAACATAPGTVRPPATRASGTSTVPPGARTIPAMRPSCSALKPQTYCQRDRGQEATVIPVLFGWFPLRKSAGASMVLDGIDLAVRTNEFCLSYPGESCCDRNPVLWLDRVGPPRPDAVAHVHADRDGQCVGAGRRHRGRPDLGEHQRDVVRQVLGGPPARLGRTVRRIHGPAAVR